MTNSVSPLPMTDSVSSCPPQEVFISRMTKEDVLTIARVGIRAFDASSDEVHLGISGPHASRPPMEVRIGESLGR